MDYFTWGDPAAPAVLIQPVGEREGPEDLAALALAIGALTPLPFQMIALPVEDWNRDLSPWRAPAVFGKEDFGAGAERTLERILPLTADRSRAYLLGGYSLAGLFALWAACRTDAFTAVAAASPSLWFPGFPEYLEAQPLRAERVYLSLGDREERTRNPVMATVGDRIRSVHALLAARGIPTVLEWNPGNHFTDPTGRTARAFAWALGPGG